MCILKDHLRIADVIEPIRNLTVSDRIIFCASPANLRDDRMIPIVRAFAECVGNNRGGSILDIPDLNLDLLNVKTDVGSKDFLDKLESLHKALVLYTWLSYRFAGVFSTQTMAFYTKRLVEEKIQQALSYASSKVDMPGLRVPAAESAILQKLIPKQVASTDPKQTTNARGKITESECPLPIRRLDYIPHHLVRRTGARDLATSLHYDARP